MRLEWRASKKQRHKKWMEVQAKQSVRRKKQQHTQPAKQTIRQESTNFIFLLCVFEINLIRGTFTISHEIIIQMFEFVQFG